MRTVLVRWPAPVTDTFNVSRRVYMYESFNCIFICLVSVSMKEIMIKFWLGHEDLY